MALILLLDDNVDLRNVIELVLIRAGHTVLSADNGREGMKLLLQNPVDLVISDIVMPDQDGLETLQQARKAKPDVRFILISGDSPRYAPLYLKTATQLGAHKTLLKPFSMEELLTTVKELLPPASPAA